MNMDFSALQFDPGEATVVRTPPGVGYGYWVGGHKVSFDEASGTFALFYRERTPLEAGRGGVCRSLGGDMHADPISPHPGHSVPRPRTPRRVLRWQA